jgi:hypothetical protein
MRWRLKVPGGEVDGEHRTLTSVGGRAFRQPWLRARRRNLGTAAHAAGGQQREQVGRSRLLAKEIGQRLLLREFVFPSLEYPPELRGGLTDTLLPCTFPFLTTCYRFLATFG